MRVDGPSAGLGGFTTYTQKIADDSVNPNLVAASHSNSASDQTRAAVDASVTEGSLESRASFSKDVVDVRAQAINYALSSADANQAAEQSRDDFASAAYEKGSIVDTVA